MSKSLQTIVLSAVVDTMITPAEADSPPMNSGNGQKRPSGLQGQGQHKTIGDTAEGESSRRPASAIGSTNRLIASR